MYNFAKLAELQITLKCFLTSNYLPFLPDSPKLLSSLASLCSNWTHTELHSSNLISELGPSLGRALELFNP
jgi:hypothetical protein